MTYFSNYQGIVCLESGSASWRSATGGYLAGTGRGGKARLSCWISCQIVCDGHSGVVMFVSQALADRGAGGEDSTDAAYSGRARPKVRTRTRVATFRSGI